MKKAGRMAAFHDKIWDCSTGTITTMTTMSVRLYVAVRHACNVARYIPARRLVKVETEQLGSILPFRLFCASLEVVSMMPYMEGY